MAIQGQDTSVNVYDYRSIADGKAVPYGIYDVVHNSGFVNVGIDHETAEFAVESIRHWWGSIGSGLYPTSKELLIEAAPMALAIGCGRCSCNS